MFLSKTRTVFVILSGLIFASQALAQAQLQRTIGGPRPASAPAVQQEPLKVKKYFGLGRQCLIKTPVYNTSHGRTPGQEQEWFRIAVQYETSEDWLDNVVFQYYVMAVKKEQGQEVYSLYKKTVRYGDVAKGKAHLSDVFLRPVALKRYGDVVATAVEILVDGKTVATEQDSSIKLPEKWWDDQNVLKVAIVREGYLLDRSQSPFALLNIDDYEVIR